MRSGAKENHQAPLASNASVAAVVASRRIARRRRTVRAAREASALAGPEDQSPW